MGVLDAGLPKESSVSAVPPIGSLMAAMDAGYRFRLADGSEWLRSGVVVPAGNYPVAASLPQLRAHIFTASVSTAPTAGLTGIATNGSGTWVAAFGFVTTDVYVSTDDGVTWAIAASNLPFGKSPTDVCWTGTRFVCVGNDAVSRMCYATSPDGVTWTSAGSTTFTIGATENTARCSWNGTNVVAVCQSNRNDEGIFTSPTGLPGTWTARSPGGVFTLNTTITLVTNSVGNLIQYTSSSANYCKSTDGGVTWSQGSFPEALNSAGNTCPAAFTSAFTAWLDQTRYYYSTDLTNWGVRRSMLTPSRALSSPPYRMPSGRVIVPASTFGDLLYSDDGLLWYKQGMSYSTTEDTSGFSGSDMLLAATSTRMVFGRFTANRKMAYAVTSMNASNGVGLGVSNSTASVGGSYLFVRVK